MDAIATYLDRIETQLCRDGFMTHTLRRHLDDLGRIVEDDVTGRRIDRLVARYNMPYSGSGLPNEPVAAHA